MPESVDPNPDDVRECEPVINDVLYCRGLGTGKPTTIDSYFNAGERQNPSAL
jgi:hypothetical protein